MQDDGPRTICRRCVATGRHARRQPRLRRGARPPVCWAMEGVAGLVALLGLLVAPPAALAAGGATPQEMRDSAAEDGRLRRVALVVGNDAYDSLRPLENAVNDAQAVAAALTDVGFAVTTVTDGTRRKLGSALVKFLEDVRRGDVALFYFAGHGVQVDEQDYLVSIDHAGVSEAEVRVNELSVARVVDELRGQAELAIVIVDACRNSPFPTRTTNRHGLAQMTAPRHTLIAYAAAPGATADDGEPGENGLFTGELVRALQVPGLEVVELFREVGEGVKQASGGQQYPHFDLDLLTPFVFRLEGGSAEVFRDCPQCPEMVTVPARRFGKEAGRDETGRPDDEVESGGGMRPFALSKYEVTFAEYEKFVANGSRGRRVPSDGGWGRRRRPVINVSWDDAAAYTEWLSQVTDEDYRLPSEREWEYAARAGTTTQYSWGADIGRGRANCADCGDNWERGTAEVGQFAANAWGLHDTAGNVWEWVADCWREEESGARRGSAGGESRGDCRGRIARGGSWANRPENVGPSARSSVGSGRRHRAYGFRVAKSLGRD